MAQNNAINNSSSTLTVATDFNVSASSIMTNPGQPAFSYYAATAQPNVSGNFNLYTVIFDGQFFDRDSNFDGTSTFTAPVSGVYCFSTTISFTGIAVNHIVAAGISNISASVNSGYFFNQLAGPIASSGSIVITGSAYYNLTASQQVQVFIFAYGGAQTVGIDGSTTPALINTTFSGFLIG